MLSCGGVFGAGSTGHAASGLKHDAPAKENSDVPSGKKGPLDALSGGKRQFDLLRREQLLE